MAELWLRIPLDRAQELQAIGYVFYGCAGLAFQTTFLSDQRKSGQGRGRVRSLARDTGVAEDFQAGDGGYTCG